MHWKTSYKIYKHLTQLNLYFKTHKHTCENEQKYHKWYSHDQFMNTLLPNISVICEHNMYSTAGQVKHTQIWIHTALYKYTQGTQSYCLKNLMHSWSLWLLSYMRCAVWTHTVNIQFHNYKMHSTKTDFLGQRSLWTPEGGSIHSQVQ